MKQTFDLPLGTQFVYDTGSKALTLASLSGMTCGHNSRENDFSCSGLAVVHPDILTAGGILETKKIGDMAEEYGVQMNIHMAESPVACLAAGHVAAATRNFMALELHSVDVPWWGDLVNPALKYDGGFIEVPNTPGLGIESLNEELIKEKLHPEFPEAWAPTDEWDKEWANDRRWS